ncbi:putative FAD/NAD(P)-binding domain superfamily [Septoria linicola]|nr:putative FAD/NAD(P)-binding domain superfamily [Septoria linicola]
MNSEHVWHSAPLAHHPATLPSCSLPDHIDHAAAAQHALNCLKLGLQYEDVVSNIIWRDSLAFTGTFRTFFGPEIVLREWNKLGKVVEAGSFSITGDSSRTMRLNPSTSWVQAAFSFYTHDSPQAGRCSGTIGLVPAEDSSGKAWRIWLLCTVLEQPDGFPDVDELVPGPTKMPGQAAFLAAAVDARTPAMTAEKADPIDCLVVGGGGGGLGMAGRLKALGLSYVVVDKHDEVGDVWSKHRYDSVRLHTSKQYNQLPGTPLTFGPDEPYLLPGDRVSAGFKRYVDMFGISVLTSTVLEGAAYDDHDSLWLAQLRRQDGNAFEIKARHIVLAIGDMGVHAKVPEYRHRDIYKGDVVHAGSWQNATSWHGKRGIVIGSANSAHDIIADMAKAELETITMVQRSETFVLPIATFSALVDPVYNTDTPIEKSDRALMSTPLTVQRLAAMAGIRAMADLQSEKFDKLEARGLKTRRYGDLWGQLYNSQGKHFFDIGAGDLIVDGTVDVKSDALPVAYTETGLLFDDGSRLDADVIAFATGYTSNFEASVRQIFGDKVGKKVRPFWGTDAEGEILGAWKPTGHRGLWYTGHGFGHTRYYSRFVALQIKADVLERPFEAYEAVV